ncbi:Os12g0256400, partial [Oryza sativa Japonica Group]
SFGSVPMGTEIAAVPNISEGLAKISKKMMDLAAQLQVLAAQSAEQAMPLGAAERSDRRAMTFLRPRQQDFKRRLRSRMRHMQQPKVASTAPPLPKPPPRGLRPSCWACRWRCHLQPRWHGFRQEQGWRRGFWKRQEQQSCFHRYFQQRRWRKRRLLLPWSHGVKQGHHVLLGMALNTIEGDRDSVFPQLRQLNGPDWWTGLRSAASPCWLRYAYHTGQSSWAFRFGLWRGPKFPYRASGWGPPVYVLDDNIRVGLFAIVLVIYIFIISQDVKGLRVLV